MAKTVLIIINNFKIGGAERVASIIANRLSQDFEVHAIVGDGEINYPLDSKVILHVLHNSKLKAIKVPIKCIQIARIVRQIHPDCIYAFGNSSAMYGAYCKKILSGHSVLVSSERTDPTREPTNPLMVLLRDIAYSNSDYLVCQTSWVKSYFENKKNNSRCIVIPNPISPDLPKWRGQESNIIITACRLEPQKNLPLLINAFEKLHKDFEYLQLVIYGEGYLRKKLQKIIDKKGLSNCIKMPGFSTNLYEEMANAKMYVSSSDYEGISNSMLEALGIGLPIIHTDCPIGGAKMFINHEVNGLLVDVGDCEGLYRAMERLVVDSKLAMKCSERSIEINRLISVDIIVRKWVELFMSSFSSCNENII